MIGASTLTLLLIGLQVLAFDTWARLKLSPGTPPTTTDLGVGSDDP
jgi:hypothetical protein